MNHRQQMQQFSKLLSYILERQPDEFGLIPDQEGFVGIKELIKALGETQGWRHIRRSHLNELMLAQSDPPIEIRENRIRGKTRDHLPAARPCGELPKTLYTFVRKKAWPVVVEKGVRRAGQDRIVCTPDRETSERLGKRKDNQPVVLTVHTDKAEALGIEFTLLGSLYLAEYLPPETFTGPPLPKMPEQDKKAKKSEDTDEYRKKAGAGSYTIRAEDLPPARNEAKPKKGKGKKKDPDWKQEQRKKRRR
ncbi:MAG: RNA 2'-phosphotransferase [Desulfobacterales bacterium]|nr:RNA 2'-phosphotransferase [Desulfobacterales bacterium]